MTEKRSGKKLITALIAVLILLAFLFTSLGYPGFMLKKFRAKTPDPVITTPEQLLESLPDGELPERLILTGNSAPFTITPQPGVTISAEENALDTDREFTLTPCGAEKVQELNSVLDENNCGMDLVKLWEHDAGLADDEYLPGTYHVDIDLDEIGIWEENYPLVQVCRIDDSGKWYEYASTIENGHLSFDSAQNSLLGVIVITSLTVIGGVGINEYGSGEFLFGFDAMSCFEKGVGADKSTDLGKKLFNLKISYSESVETARVNVASAIKSVKKSKAADIEKRTNELLKGKYGNVTSGDKYEADKAQYTIQARNEIVYGSDEYINAAAELSLAMKKEGLKMDLTEQFGKLCLDAYNFHKEVTKVKWPEYVVDVYLKKDYFQSGVTVSTLPFGHCYVVIKGAPLMTGVDEGETLVTIIHELLHVSQREYRSKLTANVKFDEATAQMVEFDAFAHFSPSGKVKKLATENANDLQYYFVPFDSKKTYIDGVKKNPGASNGELGYPLYHFVKFMQNNYNSQMSYPQLFQVYSGCSTLAGFTDIMKAAYNMDDKALTAAYKKFAKEYQTRFYGMTAGWYADRSKAVEWAMSSKGFDKQGDHAVIKNQAYQLFVRRIYPIKPPEGRNQEVSILLAYDENYKELTDFEMIPVGNKDYMNTRHGIMYKPKNYYSMKNVYTLEIDGGANTEDVTSGYTVWTLFAPEPVGEVTVSEGMLNFKLPEKSDAAKSGYIDGYRVTIDCLDDGRKTVKYYKVSGSGKDISLNAKNLCEKDTDPKEAHFRISICEYIKEANGRRSFGPESDPINSIVDTMNETLAEMGAQDGVITAALGWQTADDLDLHVVTPDGSEIYYGNKSAGGGTLDVDMQVSDIVSNPAEHIVFPAPAEGTYKVSVVNFTDRTDGVDSPFVVVLKIGDQIKTFELTVGGYSTSVCSFTYGAPEGDEKGNEYLD